MTITKHKKRRSDELWGTVFAGIPVLAMIVFTYVPMGMAVVLSFMESEGGSISSATFLPINRIFDNYVTVLSDKYFWGSLLNNLILMLELPVSIILSVLIAELLTKKVRGTKFFKVLLFVPYVCSVTATTFMWNWLLNSQYGLVNKILGASIDWFSPDNFIWSIMIMGLWATCGYRILLFTAALTNVNGTLKEAASIDGANKLQIFTHVTLPAITPTIFYVLVMGTIGVLQSFTRIQVLDPQGQKCLTAVFYIYKESIAGSRYGVGCAASIVLALIVAGLTKLNFTLSKKWVNYDVA
jgi:multiple sugar transport system permease protein